MENKVVSVKSMSDLFLKELQGLYPEGEIKQFLHLFFNEWKGWSKIEMHMRNDHVLHDHEVVLFHDALIKLKCQVPVQYITGKTVFYGLHLSVSPGALIPRPETEELVDLIIKENEHRTGENFSILDIGTGSGCIAITLKRYFPSSTVSATDKSEAALMIARENSENNRCPVNFHKADIFDTKEWPDFSSFNLIVSNPPYVTNSEKKEMQKNVVGYEPFDALFVPDDDPLKFYEAIAEFALLHLSCPGLIYMEINERYGAEIWTLLVKKGFKNVTVKKDIHDRNRFVRAER